MKHHIVVPALALLLSVGAMDAQGAQAHKKSAVDRCVDETTSAIAETGSMVSADMIDEAKQNCKKEVAKSKAKASKHKKKH